MELLVFIIPIVLVHGIAMYFVISFNEIDSKLNRKRLWNGACEIEYACKKVGVKEINVENKGCLFRVRIADGKGVEKINYRSPYDATDIYINDELVCKIHRLKNTFTKYITVEYAEKRSGAEVYEIIMKAFKISKKKLNEYYKMNGYGIDSKSFYNN